MKTVQVSRFKAQCLGLLKDVRAAGEPLVVTLRGETLAIVRPLGSVDPLSKETVAATLRRLHPLLLAEDDLLMYPLPAFLKCEVQSLKYCILHIEAA